MLDPPITEESIPGEASRRARESPRPRGRIASEKFRFSPRRGEASVTSTLGGAKKEVGDLRAARIKRANLRATDTSREYKGARRTRSREELTRARGKEVYTFELPANRQTRRNTSEPCKFTGFPYASCFYFACLRIGIKSGLNRMFERREYSEREVSVLGRFLGKIVRVSSRQNDSRTRPRWYALPIGNNARQWWNAELNAL